MTKTEQTIVDRVRVTNDGGRVDFNPVAQTAGVCRPWGRGGGRTGREPKKTETAALERLLGRGDLVHAFGGGYAVPGHPILETVAARIDLMRMARHVEQERVGLVRAEAQYEQAAAFIRAHS